MAQIHVPWPLILYYLPVKVFPGGVCSEQRTCNGFVLQMAHFYSKISIVKKSLQNITK